MYRTLLELGCKPALKGFKFIQYGVKYVTEHPNCYVGDIYYNCADEYASTYSRIERCIRHCIQTAFINGSRDKWIAVFGNTVCDNVTNKEFIFGLATYLKMTAGDTKYWIAKVTEDCGASTWDLMVSGDTYTQALMNALSILDKNYMTSNHTRGIIGLEPVKIDGKE